MDILNNSNKINCIELAISLNSSRKCGDLAVELHGCEIPNSMILEINSNRFSYAVRQDLEWIIVSYCADDVSIDNVVLPLDAINFLWVETNKIISGAK